ncbi:hypothetical protein ABZV60_30205, partial [Streptomyces sp. NPDC004787]
MPDSRSASRPPADTPAHGPGPNADGVPGAGPLSDATLQLRLPYGRADRTPPVGPADPWSLLAPDDPLCDLPVAVPGGDGAR